MCQHPDFIIIIVVFLFFVLVGVKAQAGIVVFCNFCSSPRSKTNKCQDRPRLSSQGSDLREREGPTLGL